MFAKALSSGPEWGHGLVDPFSKFLPASLFWDPRNPSCWKEFAPVEKTGGQAI